MRKEQVFNKTPRHDSTNKDINLFFTENDLDLLFIQNDIGLFFTKNDLNLFLAKKMTFILKKNISK